MTRPKIDMERPTLAEMQNWRTALDGEWKSSERGTMSLFDAMDHEVDLYFQRFELRAPERYMAIKTGSAPADCDAAIDSIVPADIKIRVRPARAHKRYEEQAELLGKLGRGLLHAWRMDEDPLRQIATDMVIRRVGVGRIMMDDRVWSPRPVDIPAEPEEAELEDEEHRWKRLEWEARERRLNPITLEARNPRYVRWREYRGEMLSVVEHYETSVLEARAAFGNYPAAQRILKGRELRDLVWIDDIWRGEYRCILIEDEPIFQWSDRGTYDMLGSHERAYRGVLRHGYSRIPYVIAPFRELHFEDPSLRYRGMLTNAASLYPAESQVLSMHVAMLAWNAWRTYIGWTASGRDIEIVPGRMIQIDRRKGEYLEILGGEPVPPELLQTAAVMDQYIQRNGVAQGPRTQEGTRSAQQVWAIQSIRQLKIESAKQALQRLVVQALGLATEMIEFTLRDALTLPLPGRDREGRPFGEMTVRPSQIQGYHEGYEVSFGRRLDPALIQQAISVMGMALNKWMPREVSYELSGLTDSPQEWKDMLMRESVEGLDFMMELGGLEELKSWYGENSEEVAIYMQRMQAAQIAAGAGGPGNPQGGTMQAPGIPRDANSSIGGGLMAGAAANTGGSSNGSVNAGGAPGGGRPMGAGGGGAPGETGY